MMRHALRAICATVVLWTLTVVFASCSSSPPPTPPAGESDSVASTSQELPKGTPGAVNGAIDYCTTTNPCIAGEGDCDGDTQCASGLKCGSLNGPQFHLGYNRDVCVLPRCVNGVRDEPFEAGVDCDAAGYVACGNCLPACADDPAKKLDAGDYCFECLCAAKEGDCDSDGECAGDLQCATNYGARFNLHSGTDVCVQQHCYNDSLDPGETAIDCGGPDCGNCNELCQGPPGSDTFCAYCRCTTGQGDCDYNRDCMPGEVCAANYGPMFGLPQITDVCVPAHCNDDVQQANLGETGIDCGGECGNCLPTCETGTPGGVDYCVGCRCKSGQGDCDSNRECAPGLICSPNGTPWGQPGVAVCVPSGTSGGETACDGAACCPAGMTVVTLTAQADIVSNTQFHTCIAGLAGDDQITSTSASAYSFIMGGPGNDTLTGYTGSVLRGGPGNDTLTMSNVNGTLIGNEGDDMLYPRGKTYVVPGPGRDTVTPVTQAGPTTVVINDLCEVDVPVDGTGIGERLTGTTNTGDTIISPVDLDTLRNTYHVNITAFENWIPQKNSCLSECVPKPNCGEHGHCIEGPGRGETACDCEPGFRWDVALSQCVCAPDCMHKRCGDDPSDKCGGTCSFCTHSGAPVGDYVAWWKFDEGSGDTTADDTGHGNTGVLGGGTASRRPLWVAGKNGQGLQFDGVDDIVDAGNAEMLSIVGPLTVEAWAKPQTAPNNTNLTIVSKGGPVYYPYELRLTMGTSLPVAGWGLGFDPSGHLWGESNTTVALEQWSHVAMVYDRATVRLYVNGSQDPVVYHYTEPVRNEVAKLFHIGGRAHPYAYGIQSFKGTLDDVRVYNRALTAAEIQNNFAVGSGGRLNPVCASKTCGSDPSDGNGGTCTGFCPPGGIGCLTNSECASGTSCVTVGTTSRCVASTCSNSVRDGNETDVDCGGTCFPCDQGEGCATGSDCGTGLLCGLQNGGCFGRARATNVCWPASCEDGVDPDAGECGQAESACGENCSCATSCDASDPGSTCPTGEVCKAGMGAPLGLPTPDACSDPRCPSNDPALCGGSLSICGECVCTPNCAAATCANPGDGCGGECPHVCPPGTPGCTSDLQCPAGWLCLPNADGSNTCRPPACGTAALVPPNCGTVGAECGDECPECVPECDGRSCGKDPKCNMDCGGGACSGTNTYCDDVSGQCVARTGDPPVQVPDGEGGMRDLPDLASRPASLIGKVQGSFSVSEVGTPEYTIPIEVPPGRAGIQPAISLKYAGSRASGDAGVGWTLDGLPKITRCPRVFSIDGYAAPIKNDSSDVFCIDGKRLSLYQGTYGANGARYRTMIDSFSKIESHVAPGPGPQLPAFPPLTTRVERSEQGPDRFTVWTKDGHIMTFGDGYDSTVMGVNGVRHVWLLKRVEDRAGNQMSIRYTNPGTLMGILGVSGAYPSEITYTGHGNTPGNRHVRFSYDPRDDASVKQVQGGLSWLHQLRLSRITTYVADQPVKNYSLTYRAQSVSQIETVSECEGGTSNRCKPPTKFHYIEESGFTTGTSGFSELFSAVQMDANGDGIADFLETIRNVDGVRAHPELEAASYATDVAVGLAAGAMSFGAGLAVTIAYNALKIGIFGVFGDRPEITYTSNMYMGTGNRNDPTQYIGNVQGFACTPGMPMYFLDYDRDGKDDAVASCGGRGYYPGFSTPETVATTSPIRVSLSLGNGSFQALGSPVVTVNQTVTKGVLPPAPFIYDIDGDSLQDIVNCVDASHVEVLRRASPDQDFVTVLTREIPLAPEPPSLPGNVGRRRGLCSETHPTFTYIDLDGDGVVELLFRSFDGWKALRYSKVLLLPQLTLQPVALPDWQQSEDGKNLTKGDFNGDGLADFWKTEQDQAVIWLNKGNQRFSPRTLTRPRPALGILPAPATYRWNAVVDYNADGIADVLENWAGYSSTPGTSLPVANVALMPNRSTTALQDHVADEIRRFVDPAWLSASFVKVGDVDGDGNLDLFGENWGMFYGKGAKNMVLDRVEDGLGNIVRVNYDAPGTYYTSADDSTLAPCASWPESCLPRMRGLVSSYEEGFMQAPQTELMERTYTYRYGNARFSATGQGWIGFDRVTVSEASLDRATRTVTKDFEPIQRTRLDGTPTTSTTPPYVYPLAGLPRSIVVDTTAATSLDGAPLDAAEHGYRRRVRTDNTWVVQQSVADLPFPHLQGQLVSVYEKEREDVVTFPPPPDIEDGELLTYCVETSTPDGYGNVTQHTRACNDESTTTTTVFTPNATDWLISNPELITVVSARLGADSSDQTQVWDPGYDSRGLLTTVVRAPNGPVAQRHTTTYVRNAYGNTEQVTETVASGEAARTTVITYDSDNIYPLTITNPETTPVPQVTQVRYSKAWGTLATVADPNGIALQHKYDGLGLLAETQEPTGTTVYTYSSLDTNLGTAAGAVYPRIRAIASREGVNGTPDGTVFVDVDNYGRRVRTVSDGFSGTKVIQEQSYDSVGRVKAVTLPHTQNADTIPSTQYYYDGLDRVTLEVHAHDDSFVEHQYASPLTLTPQYDHWLKNLHCNGEDDGCPVGIEFTIDEEKRKNVIIRNQNGQVIRNIDGENVETTNRYAGYYYGPFERLVGIRHNGQFFDPEGSDPLVKTVLEFDEYGRLRSRDEPDTAASTYTHNGYDEVATSIDPSGHQRTFHYDRLGRIKDIVEGASTTAEWKYDIGANAIGRLFETIAAPTAANPAGNHVFYSYEAVTARNRGALRGINYVIEGTGYQVGFTYDDLGRAKTVAYPQLGSGQAIVAKYVYDNYGNLIGVDEAGSSVTRELWRVTQAFEGHLIENETFDDGAAQTAYSYNSARRFLSGIATTRGSSIQALEYTHFKNGRIWSRDGSGSAHEYSYDALNRLATDTTSPNTPEAVTAQYHYDRLGNLTQHGALTNVYPNPATPHFLGTVGDNGYQYNSNGNVSQRSGPDIPGGIQTIQYTPFDLPRTIISGQAGATQTTQFEYTADEERVVRRDADRTRHFASGFYQHVLAADNATTLEQRFRILAGGRTIAEIVRTDGPDQTLFFHTDHLESTDTISTSTGAISHQEFDAFGMSLDNQSLELTRAGFTGHQHDRDLGLVDMKGRIYDPLAGRFMSPDPITQAPFWSQGLNKYTYVFNDPINHTDPSGFSANDIGEAGAFGIVFGGRAALVGGGLVYATGSKLFGGAAHAATSVNAAAPVGQGLIFSALNSAVTYFFNPWGGSASYTEHVNAGSMAPTTTAPTQNALHAGGQLGEMKAPLQEVFKGDWRQAPAPQLAQEMEVKKILPGQRCDAEACEVAVYLDVGPLIQGARQLFQAIGEGTSTLFRWLKPRPPPVAAARPGVPLSRAIEAGLVKQGGKLAQVLGNMEKGYGAASPKTALEALGVVQKATSAAGLDVGVATVAKSGEIVLENVGGISTTLGTNGSILVQRGSDILLHLLP